MTTVESSSPTISAIPIFAPYLEVGVLEEKAQQIATTILSGAQRTSIAAAWQGPPSSSRPDTGKVGMLPPHLFHGSSGIALFLAACAGVTRCPESREVALGAIYPLRHKLLQLANGGSKIQKLGGGFIGTGSFIYALSQVALLLDDAELALDSIHIAEQLLTPEAIAEQSIGELIQGVSGLLLAGIAVDAMANRFRLPYETLTSARACGSFLLRLASNDGFDSQRTGFGHGLSGMAYALIRLHELDPSGQWLQLAHRALAAERALFDAESSSWLHPQTGRPVEQNAWCHGATGMLLTRSAIINRGLDPADKADRADFQTEFDICLQKTIELEAPSRDHLCCGKLGLALTLQQVGHELGRPSLSRRALELGFEVAERCPDRLVSQGVEDDIDQGWPDLSLMNGLAGIGYGLLRLAHPQLSNVLILE